MKRTTTTITGVAALIGATLMITTPRPPVPPARPGADLCLAIDDEPMCDIAHSTPTSDPPPETRFPRDLTRLRADRSRPCLRRVAGGPAVRGEHPIDDRAVGKGERGPQTRVGEALG